jgi:hypothetical protein
MKKIAAISFLFVFSVLQYGKVLSYLYCELRVEITKETSLKCDCEKIITDNSDAVPPASVPHSHTQKDKLNEPFTAEQEQSYSEFDILNTSCFAHQVSSLLSGFVNLPYHPPALLS